MAGNEAEKKYADRIKQTNKTQQFIYGGFYHEEDQYREQSFNPFELSGKDWMLISAGHGGKVNTMTASWAASA